MNGWRVDSWRQLLAAGLAVAVLLLIVFQAQTGVRFVGIDVGARYTAGRAVAEGESPYDNALLQDIGARTGAKALPAYDPPPAMALYRVASALPLKAFALLIFAGSVVAMLALAVLLTPAGSTFDRLFVVLGIAMFAPVYDTLYLGQVDLIFFGAIVLAAARARRDLTSPALASAPLFKPQTLLLPSIAIGAVGIRRAPLRGSLAVAGSIAALLVFAAVVAPSATWGDWFHHLRDRPSDTGSNAGVLVLVAVIGAANGVWQASRARAAGRTIDILVVATAANSLLAGTGGWNTQWHTSLLLPMGALLVAAATGAIHLSRLEAWVLGITVGVSLTRTWSPVAQFGIRESRGAILATFVLVVVLVLLDVVPLRVAAGIVVLSIAVIATELSFQALQVLPIAVAGVLLHFVLAHGVEVPRRGPRFAS